MKASRLDLACCMYGALDILERMIFLLKYGFLNFYVYYVLVVLPCLT